MQILMHKKVQICGERCSGTNYLQKLLEDNFDVEIVWELGWKHFPMRIPVPDDLYVICISRNVHDWVGSMLKHRHHVPAHVKDPLRTPCANERVDDWMGIGERTLLGHRYYFFETMYCLKVHVNQWIDYDWLCEHAVQWMKTLPLQRKNQSLTGVRSLIHPNVRDTSEQWTKSTYNQHIEGINESYEVWMQSNQFA